MSPFKELRNQLITACPNEVWVAKQAPNKNSDNRFGLMEIEQRFHDHPAPQAAKVFAAFETEMADYSMYHPSDEHSTKLNTRFDRHVSNESLMHGPEGQQAYDRTIDNIRAIHSTLIGDGWLVSDLVLGQYSDHAQYLVRYSKRHPEYNHLCLQLRAVYIPNSFNLNFHNDLLIHPEHERNQYCIINFDEGELTNIEIHDVETGLPLRSISIEPCQPRPTASFLDLGSSLIPECIRCIGRIGVAVHQIDETADGTRQTFTIKREVGIDFSECIWQSIVVMDYDFTPPEENTTPLCSM